ncbi:MAG: hypothetical protein ACNI3C_11795 [Candidatus Marinarcus sp.]|uniref:hypothetical protein n=1 Tax=Candidatus Marinarcus sp. TaxID=3100987 RepID=UPI003B000D55
MTMIRKFAKVYLLLDLLVIIGCIIAGNYLWLINTQVAFISAMIITLGSFWGYKKNIENRVANTYLKEEELLEDRDAIDAIDDPYDLYSEINETAPKELSAHEIKEILSQEKKKVKQNSFKNTVFSAQAFASIYRLVGYALLVLGFFVLNNNGILDIFAYLVGLFSVTLATLIINANSRLMEDQ